MNDIFTTRANGRSWLIAARHRLIKPHSHANAAFHADAKNAVKKVQQNVCRMQSVHRV